MMKFIVDGTSAAGMAEAMDDALRGAAEHLSETSDILVSLLERKAQRGGSCHVKLEVTVLPPGAQGRLRAPQPATMAKVAADAAQLRQKAEASVAWKKRIVDHFRKRIGVEVGASTRLHLESLPEFAIMGEIEREFFNRSHAVPLYVPGPSVAEPAHVTLATEKPD